MGWLQIAQRCALGRCIACSRSDFGQEGRLPGCRYGTGNRRLELFYRQAPEVLAGLLEVARIESSESSVLGYTLGVHFATRNTLPQTSRACQEISQ